MKDRVIVNCAIGGQYPVLQDALRLACLGSCPDTDLMFAALPDGCPPHSDQQYAFKIFAIRKAIAAGYRYILWMDCTFKPLTSIEPLWIAVARDGWYAPKQGDAKLGEWCSDTALDFFCLSRDAAMTVPLVYSGLVGLDMQGAGAHIWKLWEFMYEAGTFNGPHRNVPGSPMQPWGNKTEGHVSHDPRVFGHRHDEAALSAALNQLGLIPESKGFLDSENAAGFIGRNFLEPVCR